MSSSSSYLKGYEELLRAIYDKPIFIKLKLERKPLFLDDDVRGGRKLKFINQALNKYVEENRKTMVISLVSDFKEEFFNELESFIINMEDFKEPYYDRLMKNIDEIIYKR